MEMDNWFAIVTGVGMLMGNWYTPAWGEEPTCVSDQNVGIRLAMNSRRNDSGRWESQMEFVHGEGHVPRSIDRTFRCGGTGKDSHGFTAFSLTLMSRRYEPDDESKRTTFSAAVRLLGSGREIFLSETHLNESDARRTCVSRGMRLARASRLGLHALRRMLRAKQKRWGFVAGVGDDAGADAAADDARARRSANHAGPADRLDGSWRHRHSRDSNSFDSEKCFAVGAREIYPEEMDCDLELAFFCEHIFVPTI